MSAATARSEALSRLIRVEEDEAYVSLIDREEARELDPRDRRLVTEIVAGVTRWRRYLDFLIDAYYEGDAEALEPGVRQILRIGAYEMLFLRTPAYAAIDQSVELARSHAHEGVTGLVNGILRSLNRDRENEEQGLPEPESGDLAEDLAVRYSHPTWMVARWVERYGAEETRALLEANNRRPTYAVRANRQKITPRQLAERLDEEGISYERSPWIAEFFRLEQVQPVLDADLVSEGLCAVQDEGAGAVVDLLDPRPGETVIDLCAAPGGKTLFIAERMEDSGTLLAADLHERRMDLLRESAERHGLSNIRPEVVDGRELALQPEPPRGDRVLVDVPCTGLGVLSKRADLRWNRTAEDLEDLVQLQEELLDAAARMVRPGGLLVYSTCSLEPEENEEQVAAFLERNHAFEREEAGDALPEELVRNGALVTLPHEHGIDGAFAVRLRRSEP